ncbi:HDOD domain-containing protein [Sporosarcina oncorhynchi]|uniref:HDOD domain-containing protein n=1 Tax=Sporosarcina oncorhynchi TaxID=3056444 RepID=A0ABZ0L6Z9_9BACL|nr:HDOD domain-containing protein [Sporosarcina sp. T2O-4]WOV88344.1 HDOD domain-containing protein [Sporosarcina sp. T2O-4]
MEPNVFVGRQPILDREGAIFGYELLYRNSEINRFPNVDAETATLQVIFNSFLSIGIETVAGRAMSFINFSGELLSKDIFSRLRASRVIVEILEDVEITPILISRLREIKEEGFQLALDDFILQEQYKIHHELFELIDYVKVDYLQADEMERRRIEKFIHTYPHIRMVAEKIETEAQYEEARDMGYDLFQGYFFAKPEIITGTELPPDLHQHMLIINRLNDVNANVDEIANLILHDISLTYKLLRVINTMNFEIPKRVTSVKHAVVLIGMDELKKWLRILMLHTIGEQSNSGRVQALVSFSLTRARLCELVAKRTGKVNSDEYFFVGMFSLLDAIMKKEWDDILPLIPFTDEVSDTLKGIRTEMTPYLELAIAVERFDWQHIRKIGKRLGVSEAELSAYSYEAIKWSQKLE